MPNHKATWKSLKIQSKKRLENVALKSQIRTLQKKLRQAVQDNNLDEAKALFRSTASVLDTAAKKHILHPNNASRHKSRLMKLINKSAAN